MPGIQGTRRVFRIWLPLLLLALGSLSCWERDPDLEVSVSELDFGGDLTRLEFTIRNAGEDRTLTNGVQRLDYKITVDQPWVSVHPPSGGCEEGAEVLHVVKIDRDSLVVGSNVAALRISSNGGRAVVAVRAVRGTPGCTLKPIAPWNPTPVDDAAGVSVNADLVWSDGTSQCLGLTATYDVYFGTTSPPPLSHNNGSAKSWDPGPLEYRRTYYWRIVAKDANGATSGVEWSFRTESVACTAAPTAPSLPAPADDELDLPLDQDLAWTAGESRCEGLSATYDVYFGTTSPPPFSHNNGSGKAWDPGPLASKTTYYWRVVAKDANGSTSGPEWSFRTLSTACVLVPSAPVLPSPADDAIDLPLDQDLSWTGGESQCASLTATYDVYFGTTSPPPFSHNNGSAKAWDPGALASKTTYYWRVVAKDANGSTSGPEWSFRTLSTACVLVPTAPATPAPGDDALAVPVNTDLAWSGGLSQCAGLTATYDVYFGTTSPPPFSHNNGTAATWDPGTLANRTSYYWRIVAKDGNGSTSGAEWSFRTVDVACTLAPTAPWGPAPGTNTTGASTVQNLSWNGGLSQCAGLTATYDVYFGTATPPPFHHNNGSTAAWDPGPLQNGTKYYWRVVAKDANGSTSGAEWNFTTAPASCTAPPTAPANVSPSPGATGISINEDLAWTAGLSQCAGLTATYDVYFGTTTPPPFVLNTGTGKVWDPGTLQNGTTYHWRVVAKDANGSTSSAEWSFITAAAACVAAPTSPSGAVPASGTTGFSINGNIAWSGGVSQCAGLTATYDVYFGTGTPPPFDHDNGTSKAWDPGTLQYSTTYYWQVVAKDANGETPGPVWSFTTEAPCLAVPTTPCSPTPTDARGNVNENTNLAWGCGDSQCAGLTASYDVYFGTNPTPGEAERLGTTSVKSWDLPRLAKATKYYWQVIAKDANGTQAGPVWSFTTRK
jgi:hypothetical protein